LSEFVFLLHWHVLCFSADAFRGRASEGSLGWSSSVEDFRFVCFDLFLCFLTFLDTPHENGLPTV
jgi:hypothetical protein